MKQDNTFDKEFSNLILSASGFRKIFADEEESASAKVNNNDLLICSIIIKAFCEFYKQQSDKSVLVATDARPTGNALAGTACRVFSHYNIPYIYIGIASAPEAMAYTSLSDELGGFCYISASHNPIGHNGFKFGLDDGGVLNGQQASSIIDRIKSLAENKEELKKLSQFIENDYSVLNVNSEKKKEALKLYETFLIETAFSGINEVKDVFLNAVKLNPIGIIGELNGSARGVSSDSAFLNSLSISVLFYNDKPGNIVHPIVPEGENLNLCKSLLEKAYKENPAYILGYVPDNDGDRGNIVYINKNDGSAYILKAQEVFALCVLSELLYLEYLTGLKYLAPQKTAVIVNGPTSMRIEAIAEKLDAVVCRAEVGEANVVQLAKQKQSEGYRVRILGEGSNGGNITFPASVRDPLNTIVSFVKLLSLKTNNSVKGLFENWCNLIGIKYNPDFSLIDVLETLPKYTTTDAFEPNAKMNIQTLDHGRLKENYENNLKNLQKPFPEMLYTTFGNVGYEIVNYEGVNTLYGIGNRTGSQKGGFKIILQQIYEDGKKDIGYIWMRGSGTEPVFRILIDIQTENKNLERELLEWHRNMVQKADKY